MSTFSQRRGNSTQPNSCQECGLKNCDCATLKLHRVLRVTGPAFRLECIKCGKKTQSDREPVYADLDGKPFVDYYCKPCAISAGATLEEEK